MLLSEEIPKYGYLYAPSRIRNGTMRFTRLMEIEKPTPEFTALPVDCSIFVVRMDWLMPMTSPFRLNNGPPELPGLMAASVWIMSPALKKLPDPAARFDGRVRPRAETI